MPNTPRHETTLDRTRPHKLIDPAEKGGKAARFHPQLEYEYLDNGERVIVPNTTYNQTFHTRLSDARAELNRASEDLSRLNLIKDPDIYERYKAQVLRKRISDLNARIAELTIAAQNEGMGIYSCGNPLPDNIHMPRTCQAWDEYKRVVAPELDRLFSAMSDKATKGQATHEAFDAWQAALKSSLYQLQAAYYFDTSHINSRSNCLLLSLHDIERAAARAQGVVTQDDMGEDLVVEDAPTPAA